MTHRAFLIACMGLGLGGCASGASSADDSGDEQPAADGGAGLADAGARPDAPPANLDAGACEEGVDVVLVLDITSTMNFVLDDLEDNIGSVVDAANELSPGAHFGLIAFADNHAIDATGSDGAIHTEAETLIEAFGHYREVYTANNRNPGDGPDGLTTQNPICEENSLDALHAAATEFPWRQGATRVIIVATDDTFLEAPDNYGDKNADGDFDDDIPYNEADYPARHTVAETSSALEGLGARVFSFSSTRRGSCGTTSRYPDGAVGWGWSQPYDGQAPFPELTGGRDYSLDAVESGDLSLAQTISEVVLESHCDGVE